MFYKSRKLHTIVYDLAGAFRRKAVKMHTEVYHFYNEILSEERNIWIQGDSDTGKTTLIKHLFDSDKAHCYKLIIGGCPPATSTVYYDILIEEITRLYSVFHGTLSIYIDEIENDNFVKLMKSLNSISLSVKLVVVSHHLPPINMMTDYKIYKMSEILPVEDLRTKIMKSYKIHVPDSLTIADCFYIIDNIDNANSETVLVDPLLNIGRLVENKKKVIKSTIDYSIWIMKTPKYDRVNVITIREG